MIKKMLQTYNFPMRSKRNLGTFNTHHMEQNAQDIFFHYAGVNAVDNHAYPELEFIKEQCAAFFLTLFNADEAHHYHHFTTSGSSESVLLAMLVLKKQHEQLHTEQAFKPNIIIGANSHIAWYKAARYLGIDLRVAPLDPLSFTIDTIAVMALIDAHTIGICGTLGAPTTLLCDDILELNTQLEHHFQITGQFIPIHVDAASGGFVMPLVSPDIPFDFRLGHVFSINVSSHKYGLIYPSLGWLFMRYTPCLDELLDESKYLGTSIKRFSMQFSHAASHLMTQYYYIQTLGQEGYKAILLKLYDLSSQLKQSLLQTQSNIQCLNSPQAALPGVVFSVGNKETTELSNRLKEKNWYLPVYLLPCATLKLTVARVVIRHGFNEALMDNLISDMATTQVPLVMG